MFSMITSEFEQKITAGEFRTKIYVTVFTVPLWLENGNFLPNTIYKNVHFLSCPKEKQTKTDFLHFYIKFKSRKEK